MCIRDSYYLSNGDDGYALVYGLEPSSPVLPGSEYIILDWLGDWNGDPGSGLDVCGDGSTKNHTNETKSSVLSGNGGDWFSSAGTNADDCEWIVYDQNEWSYVGSHTVEVATNNEISLGAATDSSLEVVYNSDVSFAGFEFNITGATVNSVYGGIASDSGFQLTTNDNKVLGFSFSGAEVPAGNGVLVNLAYQCDYSPVLTGISDNISISSPSGNVIAVFDGVQVNVGALGCTDSTACNYDSLAQEDDGTCVYIQEGECDCDGNIDADFDGICDNEDDCVGEYDNCGLCLSLIHISEPTRPY